MEFPESLYYTKEHEWLRVEENIAYIGITDFAQSELGEIVYVDVDTLGESIAAEGQFGTIEAVKTVSDLFMPISGTVLEINSDIEDRPELVNEDPYGNGWLIKIEIADASQLASLLKADQYTKLVG